MLTLPKQVAQLAYLMEDGLKDAAEEADKEKALKDVAEATRKEKFTVAENAEVWAQEAESARAQANQQRVEVEIKLKEVELRVVDAESIIIARDKEIVELKAALEESENKYYNMGFNDAENFAELVMFENKKYGFGEG